MKLVILALVLACAIGAQAATLYTEFYYNSTGTNINAGSTTNAVATFAFDNGGWVDGTGIYTATGADLSAITNGMFASVFVDGAIESAFVGRVTAVDDVLDTITLNTNNNFTGISPTTSATARGIRVEGAGRGPDRVDLTITTRFPFPFVNALLTNTARSSPRFNFKNDRSYLITNLTIASNGPMRFEGFTSIPGDDGITKLSGVSAGTAFSVLTTSVNTDIANFLIESNGNSGSVQGVSSAAECSFFRVSITCMRQHGFTTSGANVLMVECEASTNNAAGSSGSGGFVIGAGAGCLLMRCISHHNIGVNSSGFVLGSGSIMLDCVGANNGREGLWMTAATAGFVSGCDFYGNATNGITMTSASAAAFVIQNCNFALNTNGYGINSSASTLRNGIILNCGFGSGTKANGAGDIFRAAIGGIQEIGTVTYAANVVPWVDPDAGNFSINLATAINAGRGNFLQISSGYTNTIGYPDIGAAQATNSGSGTTIIMSPPVIRR